MKLFMVVGCQCYSVLSSNAIYGSTLHFSGCSLQQNFSFFRCWVIAVTLNKTPLQNAKRRLDGNKSCSASILRRSVHCMKFTFFTSSVQQAASQAQPAHLPGEAEL